VAAGDPYDYKICPPKGGNNLRGFESRQATHTLAVILALSCSKIGSASSSSRRIFANR
jgi:hypothetical protein